MNAWLEVSIYIGTVLLGVLTNFLIASFYAGRYKERVERLTKEINNYEMRLAKLEQQFAAVTGQAGGINYRK